MSKVALFQFSQREVFHFTSDKPSISASAVLPLFSVNPSVSLVAPYPLQEWHFFRVLVGTSFPTAVVRLQRKQNHFGSYILSLF